MSLRINQNPLSIGVHRQLMTTQHALDQAVTRLSSGLRINYAWDDPAGLAVSERMRAQISSMTEAERNANYAINMLATAEGALSTIDDQLIRMRSLSVEASNGAMSSLDRSYLDTEFQQLKSEITRIAEVTNYNGLYLIDGTYAAGAGGAGGQGIKLHIGTYNVANQDFYYINLADMTSSGLGLTGVNLLDTAAASTVAATIATGLRGIAAICGGRAVGSHGCSIHIRHKKGGPACAAHQRTTGDDRKARSQSAKKGKPAFARRRPLSLPSGSINRRSAGIPTAEADSPGPAWRCRTASGSGHA